MLNTSGTAVEKMKMSYHSIVVPIALATATRRSCRASTPTIVAIESPFHSGPAGDRSRPISQGNRRLDQVRVGARRGAVGEIDRVLEADTRVVPSTKRIFDQGPGPVVHAVGQPRTARARIVECVVDLSGQLPWLTLKEVRLPGSSSMLILWANGNIPELTRRLIS